MLRITIPSTEFWDEVKQEFVYTKAQTLQLEHSLVSLSKWESRWNKPFLTKQEKTLEETIDYVKCMTLTQNVNPEVYNYLTNSNINEVNRYIALPMTATRFFEEKKTQGSREQITAELVYYWMIALNIPFECQKWHLNKLFTLIRVCDVKSRPPKKHSRREIMKRNAALNAARKKKYERVITMSNSSLVNCTVKSPNHSGARTHSIDRITPHCVVGQLSAESIGGCFDSSNVQASCNYGIGSDGRVVLCVDEANRSWCSSSNANDQRAVTIECASDMTHPYAMTDAVYEKLVALCVDICRRNGKTKLLWFGDKDKSLNYSPKSNEMILTVHRWFANKSCPGDWLYSRLGNLANRVTAQLGGSTTDSVQKTYKTGLYKVNIGDLNIRKGPGTNYGTNGMITDRGTYTITEIQNGYWGRLKSGAGWISVHEAYCTYKGAVSSDSGGSVEKPSGNFLVQVDISDLYIRKGPGTNYGTNGFCPKGVYTIVEVKTGAGSDAGWGKLKSGAGWISLDYATRI